MNNLIRVLLFWIRPAKQTNKKKSNTALFIGCLVLHICIIIGDRSTRWSVRNQLGVTVNEAFIGNLFLCFDTLKFPRFCFLIEKKMSSLVSFFVPGQLREGLCVWLLVFN